MSNLESSTRCFVAGILLVFPLSFQQAKPVAAVGSRSRNACIQNIGNLKATRGIAVYPYAERYDGLRCDEIDPRIVSDHDIGSVLDGFKSKSMEGKNLGTRPNAIVYFVDNFQNITKARVVLAWQYIALGDEWDQLFPLSERAAEILRRNIQH